MSNRIRLVVAAGKRVLGPEIEIDPATLPVTSNTGAAMLAKSGVTSPSAMATPSLRTDAKRAG
jgi:hypothetical protein